MSWDAYRTQVLARWERFLGRMALVAYRRWAVTLLVLLGLSIGAGFAGRGLRMDTNLAALLPPSFQSVQDLDRVKTTFGGMGYVTVVLEGDRLDDLKEVALTLTPRLEAIDGVRFVDAQKPLSFFEDRALYFLETRDLQSVVQRIKARIKYEKLHSNPLYVDLTDASPPSLEFPKLRTRYAKHIGMQDLFQTPPKARVSKRDSTTHSRPDRAFHARSSPPGLVLLIKPEKMSSDLHATIRLVEEVRRTIRTHDLTPWGGPDQVSIGLAGRYTKNVDQTRELQRNLTSTTFLALFLIVGFLMFYFRGLVPLLLLSIPLGLGVLWTFGWAALMFDTLNILTAFIGTILMGLGVDHGIHFVGRLYAEWSDAPPEKAVETSFAYTGRAVWVGALTTLVAFACLGTSHFKAFQEFGLMAAVGMALIVFSYALTLPALIGLAVHLGWTPQRRSARAAETKTADVSYLSWLEHTPRRIRIFFVGGFLFLTLGVYNVSFNYDFKVLSGSDLPAYTLDRRADAILGRGQNPLLVPASSDDDERAVLRFFQDLPPQHAECIDQVLGMTSLVPPDQDEKYALLQDLHTALQGVRMSRIKDLSTRERLVRLKVLSSYAPFTSADLPAEVRRQFMGRSDTDARARFLLVFPSVSVTHAKSVLALSETFRELRALSQGRVKVIGETMILAELIETVRGELPRLMWSVLFCVVLCVSVLIGGVRRCVLVLVPAVATLLGMLGLLGWAGVELNTLNMIIIPVILGIGVDGGVHLVLSAERGASLHDLLNETGRSITGAILTTSIGFGVLVFTNHPGLASLGLVALLGLSVNLIACLCGVLSFVSPSSEQRR